MPVDYDGQLAGFRALLAHAALEAIQKGQGEIPLRTFEAVWKKYFYPPKEKNDGKEAISVDYRRQTIP